MPRFLVSALAAAAIHLVIFLVYPHWELPPPVPSEPDTAITIAISHVQPPKKKIDPPPVPKPDPKPEPKPVSKPAPKPEPKPVPKPLPAPPVKEPPPMIQKPTPVPDIPVEPAHDPLPEPEPTPEPEPEPEPEPASAPEAISQKPSPPPLKPTGIKKTAVPLYKDNPLPRYPKSARQRGYAGTVHLMVLVDAEGAVENLWIFESSGYTSLDEEALRTVKHWLFEPGTVDGIPEGMWVKVPVTFEIKQ